MNETHYFAEIQDMQGSITYHFGTDLKAAIKRLNDEAEVAYTDGDTYRLIAWTPGVDELAEVYDYALREEYDTTD